MAKRKAISQGIAPDEGPSYDGLLAGLFALLDQSRSASARVVNGLMTATYYELGRRIVEFEQGGKLRAEYGKELIDRLAADLTKRHGRGFSRSNLFQIRTFYLGWEIVQTPSGQSLIQARLEETTKVQTVSALIPDQRSKLQTTSAISGHSLRAETCPLPWSHYVRLMTVPNRTARRFYEDEAIKGGWSVRQLDRQISTRFYERLAGSKRKDVLLAKVHVPQASDILSAEELVRDPYILEFLNLTDEYGECDLESAIIQNVESFLVELGRGFTFVARQRKIRIDAQWYKIDLLLFHRRLRCLVVIDLKIGAFTHADAGQMNLYLNYAKEHLTEPGEHDPIGLILCSEKSETVVKYAMGGINAKVFASEYLTVLPSEDELRSAIERVKRSVLRS